MQDGKFKKSFSSNNAKSLKFIADKWEEKMKFWEGFQKVGKKVWKINFGSAEKMVTKISI